MIAELQIGLHVGGSLFLYLHPVDNKESRGIKYAETDNYEKFKRIF